MLHTIADRRLMMPSRTIFTEKCSVRWKRLSLPPPQRPSTYFFYMPISRGFQGSMLERTGSLHGSTGGGGGALSASTPRSALDDNDTVAAEQANKRLGFNTERRCVVGRRSILILQRFWARVSRRSILKFSKVLGARSSAPRPPPPPATLEVKRFQGM